MSSSAYLQIAACVAMTIALDACGKKTNGDPAGGAPPPAKVEAVLSSDVLKVDHVERFSLAEANRYDSSPELNVTGVVSPDVSRNIPVVSLVSGRVVELRARLGDAVTKGQLLMRVQSTDIAQAFSDYRQAVASETLARVQSERATILYDKGAIARKDLEVAEDTSVRATVVKETTQTRLGVLGAKIDQPSALIEIFAPASGVITEQNVTASAGVKTLDNSPNLFTIADLSQVWIVCDVYENDLSFVRLGGYAEIHLNAYPNMVIKARVANISPVMDPNLRTAKVRLEVNNPGSLRLGMFATATFRGANKEAHVSVPATAVLHLHDRDWVYTPIGNGQFRRIEVAGGISLPGNRQELLSGITPGQKVVANALVLQNSTVEQ